MISKIPPRSPAAARTESVGAGEKKVATRSPGYTGNSSFEPALKRPGISRPLEGARSERRETKANLREIKLGLRTGNDTALKAGIAAAGARLKVALPDLNPLSGWGAFGALGTALGHVMKDPLVFNRDDFRGVMKLAGGKINDPDPSNGRFA